MSEDRLEASVRRYYEDPAELAEYSAIAANGLSRFEQAMIGPSFSPGQRVLDVGCGPGREAIAMARSGLKVTALDLVPAMIELAKKNAKIHGQQIDFVEGEFSNSALQPDTFDGVVMIGQVIACIPKREKRIETLRTAARLLRSGGRLIMTTHNRRCHWKFGLFFAWVNRWRGFLRAVGLDNGLENNDRWARSLGQAGFFTPVFLHMYDLEEAVADLRAAGFESIDSKPRSAWEDRQSAGGMDDYFLGFVAKKTQ